MDNVRNKTVMITGAANGIGYKCAEILLRNGAKCIAIIDLVTSNGKNAATTLRNEFGESRVVFFACDVTKTEEFEMTFEKVVDMFQGYLDILINNAGILDEKDFERTVDVNLTSVIRGSLLALEYMGKHKGGKGGIIANVASVYGLSTDNSFAPVYSATKHGIIGFSHNLASFYEKHGVRIMTMCPGYTKTRLADALNDKISDFVTLTELIESLSFFQIQEPDNVARGMLELIQKGKNGAIWVSENSKPPYAVNFIHYSKRSTPI